MNCTDDSGVDNLPCGVGGIEGSESRHRFSFNRAKRVIDGRMFGVPLEPAEAE